VCIKLAANVFILDLGRCRFFNSVSVFGISFGIFSKSVRFSVSIFFKYRGIGTVFRFFFLISLSIDSKQYGIHTQWGIFSICQTQSVIVIVVMKEDE
jgi:hypothetical protein